MASVWHENGRANTLADDELRQVAVGMLQARRAMRGTLPAALIHDVPLEMLLTIYLGPPAGVGEDTLVSDTTISEGSARRWLGALASEDLLVVDKGRVTLSDHGSAQMIAMLTSVVQSQRELLGWADH